MKHVILLTNISIKLILEELKTFLSSNSLITEDDDDFLQFPPEFLDKLNVSGLPFRSITLKLGTIVMLLRNIDIRSGLMNGT